MKRNKWFFKFTSMAILLQACVLLAGCATNPVTGKNELMLIPESMEIQMGQENYLPSRQMQGGDYAVDPAVNAYVREIGQKLAAVSDRKLPYEFTMVNDSEVNAWMLPGGKMGINRGLLLKMDSEAELAAVIGHEITHAAAKHGAKQMQQALLLKESQGQPNNLFTRLLSDHPPSAERVAANRAFAAHNWRRAVQPASKHTIGGWAAMRRSMAI